MEEFADLAEELMAQRAADRLGETLDVLIEETVPADIEETVPVDAAATPPGTGYSGNGYSGLSPAGPPIRRPKSTG